MFIASPSDKNKNFLYKYLLYPISPAIARKFSRAQGPCGAFFLPHAKLAATLAFFPKIPFIQGGLLL
ncbi:hypothetical protein AALG83_07635 [Christensenellaceae bacterium 44-20]